MKQEQWLTVYKNEEDRQLARILSMLIWASWGGFLFGIILGLFYNDWKLTAVTLAGCALLSVPLILLRRRYLHASGTFLMLIMLGTTTFIATVGQGIRDLAVFGFLIVIIFAGLALNHTYFRLCVGLSLVAACWLVFGESLGWFATTPFEGGVTNWFYLVGMTIIFLITALAVELLATNMRKSLELARREIAQRKQAEEKNKNSDRHFQALIEHGRDNISLLAADGTLLWENPSANHILGYAPDQFRGHNIFELMHPDDQAWTRDVYAQVLQSPGRIRDGVFRLLHADRTWRWIECSATNLLDEPSVQAIVLNYRDITARKRVEKEKNIYAEELEILYQLATELSDLPAETDLAVFVARKIKELTHSFAVTFSEYNPQKKQLENVKLITDSAIISRVNAVLEKKVDSLVYPVSDEMYLEIKQNRIGFKKNLSETSFGTIPDMAGSILQKMFNLDNFIGLVVLDNDKLLGTIMLILQKGETIPSERFLTSLTYLITIAFKRKQAEEALQESESRYRQAITAAGAVPYYRDYQKETHAYTFMGEGILQLTGYSADEITPDIFDQQERECIMRGSLAHLTPDEAGQMSEAGKIQQWICDYRILTRNGQTRWVADSAIQIRDENNRRIGVIGILQDITERKQAEEALRASELKYRSLIESSSDAIFCVDEKGQYQFTNQLFASTFGKPPDYFIGKTFWDIYPKEHADYRFEATMRVFQTGESESIEVEVPLPDKSLFFYATANPIKDETGKVILVLTHAVDITERKRMEKELLLSELDLKEAQSIAHIGSWKWDVNSGEVFWSDEMFRIFGIEKDSYIGRLGDAAQKAMHPDDLHILLPANAANIANVPFEYRIILPDGSIRLIWAKAANTIFDQEGKPTFLFGVAQDITESRLTEEQLRYQSTHDTMTGIYNRAFFETELARLERGREFPASVIIADTDNLKVTNDTWGHAAGDELLRQTANVLRSVFREGEVVARIGGDEFAVLLPSTDSASAEKMLARVQERLAKHNAEHPDLPLVQLSLGAATAEKNNLTEAFTIADRRMYANKAARKADLGTDPVMSSAPTLES